MKLIKKLLLKIFLIIILALILVAGFFAYKGYLLYKIALEETPISKKVEQLKSDENYVSLDNVPEDFINAVISVEDHRFYEHGAIDIISISRAIFTNVKNGELSEGGSTITQQLCKNIYFTQKKEATRKFAEIFMGIQLEKELSKDDILELYINTNYYGSGFYGLKAASYGYFNKAPNKLNLYECTLLAGVPNAPSVYAPTKNPDLAAQRQVQVVNAMIKYNYLSESERKEALSNT